MRSSALPATMQIIGVQNPGDTSTLVLQEAVLPELKPGYVMVKVVAAGVNRADLLQRSGKYPPPPGESDILGLEVSGTVVAVEQESNAHWLGKAVFGLVPGGGYAEYVALPAEHLMLKPEALSFCEAAGCAEVFLTAYQALKAVGNLPSQGAVLIHAGASGVGTAAIQLAKHFGAKVAVTVGSQEKAEACLALGADVAVNYREEDFSSVLKEAFPKGFHVVIDPVGGDYINKNVRLLAMDGQIVVLAMLGGRYVKELDLAQMLKKRGQLLCSTLRNRTDAYKAELIEALMAQCQDALGHSIHPVISGSFSFSDAEKAHELIRTNAVVGKLVLTWEA